MAVVFSDKITGQIFSVQPNYDLYNRVFEYRKAEIKLVHLQNKIMELEQYLTEEADAISLQINKDNNEINS